MYFWCFLDWYEQKTCPKCQFSHCKKNGKKRNRQRYFCKNCNHQFVDLRGGSRLDYGRYYLDWLHKRRTLSEIASDLDISIPKLTQEFDALDFADGLRHPAPKEAINLLMDATFFGREYGYFCAHDGSRIIYFCEIKTESVKHLREALYELLQAGYRFKSVTIDGRKGFYENIRKILGGVPIQMCIFHQKMIIRRYIGDSPKLQPAKDLKELMGKLCNAEPEDFVAEFYALKERHKGFLNAKKGSRFTHGRLRSAYNSMQENLHRLFTYKEFPEQNIPPTTNHLEGCFSHLKERINIHRGLKLHRKKKAIKSFLNSF